MGYMIADVYHAGDDPTETLPSGEWQRSQSSLRHWITRDGAPGPTGVGGFAAEPGRYHLFVAWNCPWAHRALLVRALKGLTDAIGISVARPRRTDQGWVFDATGDYADPLLGVAALHEVYTAGAEPYTGRVTVPVLWDCKTGRIVSNESADILRMLDAAFDGGPDLRPADLVADIDAWNAEIYAHVNNGVYKTGFASTQDAYQTAARAVFATLDRIEDHLGRHRWLCGARFTEADLRLFPTLARFDVAYHYAFRCNLRRLMDYPHLWAYAREIYAMPGIAATVHPEIYKQGYFSPSEKRNPLGIVPIGPQVDWDAPHGRG